MKLCLRSAVLALAFAVVPSARSAEAQQPRGVPEALLELSSQPATHTSVVFDRDMLQSMWNERPLASLNSITFESYRYHNNAFYTPEGMSALVSAYNSEGWKHLVNANASPRDSASPVKPITDMWLHFRGGDIDGCTVLIRAAKQMNVIEVSGLFRPLDLIHLSGHFGIPKVDPDAVMVPAPPGR